MTGRRASAASAAPAARERDARAARAWLVCSAVCVVVSYVYAQFSHGVSSPFMTWLALVPLVLGAGVYALWGRLRLACADGWGFVAYNGFVATLMMGSFVRGVLEIADTTSRILPAFAWLAAALLAVAAASVLRAHARRRDARRRRARS